MIQSVFICINLTKHDISEILDPYWTPTIILIRLILLLQIPITENDIWNARQSFENTECLNLSSGVAHLNKFWPVRTWPTTTLRGWRAAVGLKQRRTWRWTSTHDTPRQPARTADSEISTPTIAENWILSQKSVQICPLGHGTFFVVRSDSHDV